MKKLIQKKIPLIYLIVLVAISCGITYMAMQINFDTENKKSTELTENINSCNTKVIRLEGYQLIKPLMFVDSDCEGANLISTKQSIEQLIQNYKTLQGVSTASVYLRDFSNNEWINISENEKFDPGSLFKVPILMAFLKMDELSPGVLNKEILYNQPFAINKEVVYKSKTIQLGKKYKVKELLKYMIEYSDNNATALLSNNIKPEVFIKLFTDLDMTAPVFDAQQYLISAKQYSYFMRAIYNASYLSIDDSEYAAELLSKTEFNDGILKALPKDIKVVHKFGESGTPADRQLHESAIVYLNGKSYLITVMTKGKDIKVLSNLMSDISQLVYDKMVTNS